MIDAMVSVTFSNSFLETASLRLICEQLMVCSNTLRLPVSFSWKDLTGFRVNEGEYVANVIARLQQAGRSKNWDAADRRFDYCCSEE